jgi:uncharacterized protein YjbJ (UPF0337 family)
MNWDQIEGKWKQMKGSVKQQWGKLTDDDLDVVAGKKDVLVGKLQERYGITRDEAARQVRDWSPQGNETGVDTPDEYGRKRAS